MNESTQEKRDQLKVDLSHRLPLLIGKPGAQLRVRVAVHLAVMQQFVGVYAIVAYGVDIIGSFVPSNPTIIPTIINFEPILASVASSYLLSKLGRRTIFQIGTLIVTLSLLMALIGYFYAGALFGQVLVFVGFVIYMAAFGASLGPLTWLYIAEIVEPHLLPFTTLANWASATFVMIFVPLISNLLDSVIPIFAFFLLWSAVSLGVNQKYLLETKDKTKK